MLFARFECVDYDGGIHRHTAALASSKALFDPGRVLRRLRVELWGNGDELLDVFVETESSFPWGVSVLNPRSTRLSDEARDLETALLHGENETVEFKPLVRLGDGGKRMELFETVVAFANHLGGSIYFGVNDHLEVIGTSTDLQKVIKNAEDRSESALRDTYIDVTPNAIPVVMSQRWD